MAGDDGKKAQEAQKQGGEALTETQKKAIEKAKLDEAAKEAGEGQDQDVKAMFAIEADKTVESQADAMGNFISALMWVVADQKKAGIDVSGLQKDPGKFDDLVEKLEEKEKAAHPGESLTPEMVENQKKRAAAAQKLTELLNGTGPTAEYVKTADFWNKVAGKPNDIAENPTGKLEQLFKEHPYATAGVGVAIALGLGVFLGKTVFASKAETVVETPITPSPAGEKWGKGTKIGLFTLATIGAVGLYLGKDRMMKLLPDFLKDQIFSQLQELGVDPKIIAEIEKARLEGTTLTETQRQAMASSGEKGQETLAAVEAEIQKKQEEKGVEQAEVIDEKSALEAQRFLTTAQALVALYYPEDVDDGDKLKSEMIVVLEHFSEGQIKIVTVIEAYQKAVTAGKKEIDFKEVGLEENTDMSMEAIFHVGTILAKAVLYHQKRFPEVKIEELNVKEFVLRLSSDPALTITNKIQATMEEKFKELKIGSLGDIKNSAEEIFETKAIDQVIEENRAIFIEHLAAKYCPDWPTFTVGQKTEFIFNMGELYLKGRHKLDQNHGTIVTSVNERGASPEVSKNMILLWEELIDEARPLLEKCKENYDIKRSDNDEYDRILQKHLRFDMLHFSDGLQLVLLADGIDFDQAADQEGVGQMKEVSMIYLMARILKERKPAVYPYYLANLIDLSTEGKIEWKMNPRFGAIAPYFSRLFEILMIKAEGMVKSVDTIIMGLSNINDDPEKIGKLAEMDAKDFYAVALKSTGKETYQIPQEVFLTAYENFPDLFQAPISWENMIEMITALGGLVVMTKREDTNVGLIWLAGKYYFFEPAGTLLDTTHALATEGVGVASEVYFLGTAPFIVYGAIAGFGRSRSSPRLSATLSILSGMARGATAPISMPIAGYRTVRGANRYAHRWVIDRAKFGAGNSVTLERSLRLFLEYSDKAPTLGGTAQDRLEALYDQFRATKSLDEARFQLKRQLYEDLYEKARIRWGKNFARDYNNFFGLNPEGKRVSAEELDEANLKRDITLKSLNPRDIPKIEDLIEKAERMERVTFLLREHAGWARLEEAVFMDELEKSNIFTPEEMTALKIRGKKIGMKKLQRAIVAISEAKPRRVLGVLEPDLEPPAKKMTTPKRTWDGKYKYMGERYTLSLAEAIEVRNAGDEAAKQARLTEILDRRWKTPEIVAEGPAGRTYKYRGGTFKLLEPEYIGRPADEILQAIETKYINSIQIVDTRKLDLTREWMRPKVVEDLPNGRRFRYRGEVFELGHAETVGQESKFIADLIERRFAGDPRLSGPTTHIVQEYKIGDEWIRPPETPDAMEVAKRNYVEAAKKAGLPFEHIDFENSRVLKYLPILQHSLGPAVGAMVYYQLETTPNKREAVAEAASGWALFMGTMKTGQRLTRTWKPKTVMTYLGKNGAILFTSMLSAYGFTEPLGDILEDYMPNHEISSELASLMEKTAITTATLQGLSLLEKRVLEKGLTSKGLQSLSAVLSRKLEGSFATRIHQFARKDLVKKIGGKLGLRGAILAATVADDATVIGVLDDVVAVGMAAWMAKDIYDLADLTRKSWKISKYLEKSNKMEISGVEPVSIVDKKALEAELAKRSKLPKGMEAMNEEERMKAVDQVMGSMTPEEQKEMLESIKDIHFQVKRAGSIGYEEYHFVNGEVFSVKIKTESGEIIELSDEELNQDIGQPLPQEFKPFEIDYKAPPEKLLAEYRLAILYTKSECGWTKLDFEPITSDKEITFKRLDGPEQTKIIRSGEKWSVEGYSGGHDLFQAIVLANLTNKVEGILAKEGYEAASNQPFEVEGDAIDFDRNWNPNDLRVLSDNPEVLNFYGKIGLTPQNIADTLNNLYAAEHRVLARAA